MYILQLFIIFMYGMDGKYTAKESTILHWKMNATQNIHSVGSYAYTLSKRKKIHRKYMCTSNIS